MTASERSDAVILYVILYFVEYSDNEWYIIIKMEEDNYEKIG
jgi:hypothetical protein